MPRVLRTCALAVACAAALALAPPSLAAAPRAVETGAGPFLWRGDFDEGLAPFGVATWNYVGAPAPRAVTRPVRQGGYSGRFVLPPSVERSELIGGGGAPFTAGQVRYFGFSVRLSTTLALNSRWRVLAQWKNDGTGSPPLQLSLHGATWRLEGGWNRGRSCRDRPDHRVPWAGLATRGRWTDFVLGVRFQATARTGWVELYRDGALVLRRTPFKTLYRGCHSYLKLGLYRHPGIRSRDLVHHDDWRIGPTYASVAGP